MICIFAFRSMFMPRKQDKEGLYYEKEKNQREYSSGKNQNYRLFPVEVFCSII